MRKKAILQIDNLLSAAVPEAVRVPVHFWTQRLSGRCDPMIPRLPSLILRRGTAIDVGANQGLYTYALARLSKRVEAFEPQPWCATRLEAYANRFQAKVVVHEVGLSDEEAKMELKVPYFETALGRTRLTGLASLARSPDDAPSETVSVDVRTLDSYAFQDVTFIKIDVEGYEGNVIDGASRTISLNRPVVMVEIEQRHLGARPIEEVFRKITAHGYSGGFYFEGKPAPLEEFSYSRHQEAALDNIEDAVAHDRYANNFIFWPRELAFVLR